MAARHPDVDLAERVLPLLPEAGQEPVKPCVIAKQLGVSRSDVNRVLHRVLKPLVESPVPGRWCKAPAGAPPQQAPPPPPPPPPQQQQQQQQQAEEKKMGGAAAPPAAQVSERTAVTDLKELLEKTKGGLRAKYEGTMREQRHMMKCSVLDANGNVVIEAEAQKPRLSRKEAKRFAAHEALHKLGLCDRADVTEDVKDSALKLYFDIFTRGQEYTVGKVYKCMEGNVPNGETTVCVELKGGANDNRPQKRVDFNNQFNRTFSQNFCAMYNLFGSVGKPFHFQLVYGVHDVSKMISGIKVFDADYKNFCDEMKNKVSNRLKATVQMSSAANVDTFVHCVGKNDKVSTVYIIIVDVRFMRNYKVIARQIVNDDAGKRVQFKIRRDAATHEYEQHEVEAHAKDVINTAAPGTYPQWLHKPYEAPE